ncbi:GNAT family N-acetyltransferase/peptidase C39 family protein [Limibacillus halophilus]|uniref:Ribosomal protein S18 acetylase RimI-like enzyme n=1 Tax=Limibacillus halophilus TaxID=1579333 RepID=A0A839SUN2_9PROT|nr:GNAT family N-acetyltransferase/peptidase C39 family protein [Limibacillus halophilus]MBB3065146.1 ribosomal protein S18 acetylase RimI-like enzyme [Limibacillus halophilus]
MRSRTTSKEKTAPAADSDSTGGIIIRPAKAEDLAQLVALEDACFSADKLSRRSFHHLLRKGHALFRVAESPDGQLQGYALVLLHGTSSLSRLYSLAVLPNQRGANLGARLLLEVEEAARDEGCAYVRLEVRRDNAAAIALYHRAGYRDIGIWNAYYEDDVDALRMEKRLVGGPMPDMPHVPFYEQTQEFTCGPACLLMALSAFLPDYEPSTTEELRLWREATLIFMTSGHGGCGPYGLALAAQRRGLKPEIFVTDPGSLFLQSVRSMKKRQAMKLVQEDFRNQAKAAKIATHRRRLTAKDLRRFLNSGALPVVLVSSYRMWGEKMPHWVVVTGCDDRLFYLHDPFVDRDEGKTPLDSINIAVRGEELERMARYGQNRLSAAIVLSTPDTTSRGAG